MFLKLSAVALALALASPLVLTDAQAQMMQSSPGMQQPMGGEAAKMAPGTGASRPMMGSQRMRGQRMGSRSMMHRKPMRTSRTMRGPAKTM